MVSKFVKMLKILFSILLITISIMSGKSSSDDNLSPNSTFTNITSTNLTEKYISKGKDIENIKEYFCNTSDIMFQTRNSKYAIKVNTERFENRSKIIKNSELIKISLLDNLYIFLRLLIKDYRSIDTNGINLGYENKNNLYNIDQIKCQFNETLNNYNLNVTEVLAVFVNLFNASREQIITLQESGMTVITSNPTYDLLAASSIKVTFFQHEFRKKILNFIAKYKKELNKDLMKLDADFKNSLNTNNTPIENNKLQNANFSFHNMLMSELAQILINEYQIIIASLFTKKVNYRLFATKSKKIKFIDSLKNISVFFEKLESNIAIFKGILKGIKNNIQAVEQKTNENELIDFKLYETIKQIQDKFIYIHIEIKPFIIDIMNFKQLGKLIDHDSQRYKDVFVEFLVITKELSELYETYYKIMHHTQNEKSKQDPFDMKESVIIRFKEKITRLCIFYTMNCMEID